MADDIIWEEPRPSRARGRERLDWQELLRPLTEHPKRWARVRHYDGKGSANQVACSLRKGKYPLILGRWEFAAQLTDEEDPTKGSDLYVRFMGDGDA
jgi:hypothetical protein